MHKGIFCGRTTVFVCLRKQPPWIQELPVLSTTTCVLDAPMSRNVSGTARDFGMQLMLLWRLEPVVILTNSVHLREYCRGPSLQNSPVLLLLLTLPRTSSPFWLPRSPRLRRHLEDLVGPDTREKDPEMSCPFLAEVHICHVSSAFYASPVSFCSPFLSWSRIRHENNYVPVQ